MNELTAWSISVIFSHFLATFMFICLVAKSLRNEKWRVNSSFQKDHKRVFISWFEDFWSQAEEKPWQNHTFAHTSQCAKLDHYKLQQLNRAAFETQRPLTQMELTEVGCFFFVFFFTTAPIMFKVIHVSTECSLMIMSNEALDPVIPVLPSVVAETNSIIVTFLLMTYFLNSFKIPVPLCSSSSMVSVE